MSKFEKIIKEKSDSELTDIFINGSGYQEEFISQVQEELANRNIPIDALTKLRNEQQKIDETTLEKGEQGSQFWIAAAFIGSILGGIWAIFAGYSYAYSKHKVNGKEYYVYNESTRKYGKIMLMIGGAIFTLVILNSFF
jgi:uncharacterized membrane protein YidH (DUF202 family)